VTDNERKAMRLLTERVIKLEAESRQVREDFGEAVEGLRRIIVKLEDEIAEALDKPRPQMSEEDIARSMDSTAWKPPV
jgi:hypothetical protein